MTDLTIIYYTSNYLDDKNPEFLVNTKKQLLKAADGLPIISVSHKPIELGTNICVGDIGRHHLNIYKQILIGCKAATTKYVAMAEDDILYSYEHFHSPEIEKEFGKQGDVFLYDMLKVSLFTWTNPPLFSFRTKRRVVNQLIAPRQLLIDSLEERFTHVEKLQKKMPLEEIIKYWCDPGRNERSLGVTVRPSAEFYSNQPSIVFTHPLAYGYLNHGKRKRLGDLRIVELYQWGKASDILKLWGDSPKE